MIRRPAAMPTMTTTKLAVMLIVLDAQLREMVHVAGTATVSCLQQTCAHFVLFTRTSATVTGLHVMQFTFIRKSETLVLFFCSQTSSSTHLIGVSV